MKAICGFLFGLSMALAAQAQVISESARLAAKPSLPEATPYTIVGRGPNHITHARVAYLTNRFHQVIARTNSYTQIETGLNYFEDGQWKESSAEIEITKDGAVANKTPHKVAFDGNINTAGAVELVTPDGKHLRSHVLGLSYADANGKSVLVAELQDSQGLLLQTKNQVLYPDAFSGDVKGDILYTVTKAGLEQNIIIREQPPSPKEWGLDPATTTLQILSEFLDPPEPAKEQVVVDGQTGLTDERLDFGEMKMGRGKAFALGAAANNPSGVPVVKQWTVLDGRKFLVEEVQYNRIENSLKLLPQKPQASLPDTTKFQNVASVERKLPALPTGKSDTPVEVARLDIYRQPGFVLDYEALASGSNFTFKGDSSYFCSGDVYLDGTTTIEGGTVVKFGRRYSSDGFCDPSDPAGTISFNGPIDCKTTTYRPAIFTAMDDNTVGETISGSSGTPNGYFCASGYYGGNYSEFHGGDDDVLRVSENGTDLRHLRVSWLTSGFRFPDSGDIYLRDIQMLNCYIGMKGGANLHIQNGLFANIGTMFWCGGCSEEDGGDGPPVNVHGENLTVDNCGYFAFGRAYVGNEVFLTNSLLVGVPDETSCTLTTNHIAEVDGSAFQSVGAGNYYLASGTYRNAGTTNVNSWLLAELKTTTTYPPTILTNKVTTNTTFSIQALRDTNTLPALGYHYPPIDYAVNNLAVTNATLTIQPGTAIATFGDSGIRLWNNASLVCTGTPLDHIHFVRYYAVQEQSINWGGATNLLSTATILPVINASPLPTASFRFTDFDGMSYSGYHIYNSGSWKLSTLTLQDCTANSGTFEMENSGATANTVVFRNNLFELSTCNFQNDLELNLRNNLWKGGSTYFVKVSTNDWNITDNAFDRCAVEEDFPGSAHSHNAYIATDGRLNQMDIEDPHDIVLTNFTYATGTLGNYYQLSTNLINKGSDTATNAGLYHYTVQTNQVPETNSIVDIGFHYVALGTNGLPLDADTNNVPDYAADQEYRGNGSGGSGGPLVDAWSPDDAMHGTNLWLEISRILETNNVTNIVALPIEDLTLHNTKSNYYYQLLTKTNLKQLWTLGEIIHDDSGATNMMFSSVPTDEPKRFFAAVRGYPVISIQPNRYANEAIETNSHEVANFFVSVSDLLSSNLTVFYTIGGAAENGVDYTNIASSATILASNYNTAIYIDPIADNLTEFDEPVVLSLILTNGYVVDPDFATATIPIRDSLGSPFTTVTNVSSPIGIDYHQPTHSLLVSYNFDSGGQPYNFARIYTNNLNDVIPTNWSEIAGLPDEVKLATVKTTLGGFTNGDMYFSSTTNIGWLSANSSASNLTWCTLTNDVVTNALNLRGGLYADQTGVWSNNLIAVASDDSYRLDAKGVWRVDAQRHPTLVASIVTTHLEGVITLPNTNSWGPWAGKIITGNEQTKTIYAIDTNGVVNSFDLGIEPEDFDIIPANQDLYCADYSAGSIQKLSRNLFTNYVGALLIAQAGESFGPGQSSPHRLYIVNWDGARTNFVVRWITSSDEFEHVTFAPIDLPSQ